MHTAHLVHSGMQRYGQKSVRPRVGWSDRECISGVSWCWDVVVVMRPTKDCHRSGAVAVVAAIAELWCCWPSRCGRIGKLTFPFGSLTLLHSTREQRQRSLQHCQRPCNWVRTTTSTISTDKARSQRVDAPLLATCIERFLVGYRPTQSSPCSCFCICICVCVCSSRHSSTTSTITTLHV